MRVILTESRVDYARILEILTQSKPANEADPNYNYYKQLARWAEPGRTQASKGISLDKANTAIKISDRSLLDKNPTKLAKRYNNLGSLLTALKTLMDQEGKYNPNNATSQLIQKTTVDVLASLSGLKNQKEPGQGPAKPDSSQKPDPESTQESESNVNGRRDWTAYRAEKLAKVKPASKALSEFYDEYYSVEYAGVKPEKKREIVAKLKSLDKILIPEFNKLGYNPEVNPFASFLKILIKNKFDIFEKLTYNTYGAIHNSFIDRHITGNMLGQKFDETNILFCSDLYNKNGLDIVNYLDLQKQTLAAGKNSDIKNLIAKIFIQQDVEGETYDKKVNNLKELSSPVLPGADVAKLKSEPEIRELYRNLFGHEAKNKENDDLTKIVNETENDIILDMIYYLKSQYEAVLDDEDEAGIVKWLEDFNYKRNTTKIETSKEILSRYSKMRSAQTVLRLIGKLEAKKRKEAKK